MPRWWVAVDGGRRQEKTHCRAAATITMASARHGDEFLLSPAAEAAASSESVLSNLAPIFLNGISGAKLLLRVHPGVELGLPRTPSTLLGVVIV